MLANHSLNHHQPLGLLSNIILLLPFSLGLLFYMNAVVVCRQRNKTWPFYRIILWFIGVISAMSTLSEPFTENADKYFYIHMIGHLLLGMSAPLCMVLAAPLTLFLITLNVLSARRFSAFLQFKLFKLWRNPIFTSLLNIGGLWLLYTTNLYSMMQQNILLHIFVHFHVFIAGYLFVASFIYIDPAPHQSSFLYRSIVLVMAQGAHGILSKYLYVHPPAGVSVNQAELGSKVMYYGGDVIDLFLLIIFCYQWYKSNRFHKMSTTNQSNHKKTDISP